MQDLTNIEIFDKESWQSVELRLRHGDIAYIPANMVDWPKYGDLLSETGEDAQRLLLAMFLVNGQKAYPELPMAEYCQETRRWLEVPILCSNRNGSARLVPVLIGYASSENFELKIEKGLLTQQASEAAQSALLFWGDNGRWWIVSRLSQETLQDPIDTTSLSLPLALAAHNLRTLKAQTLQSPSPHLLFITGNMDSQGNIHATTDSAWQDFFYFRGDYLHVLCIAPEENRNQIKNTILILFVSDLLEVICLQSLANDLFEPKISIEEVAEQIHLWKKNPVNFLDWIITSTCNPMYLFPLFALAKGKQWFKLLNESELQFVFPKIFEVLINIKQKYHELKIKNSTYKELSEIFISLFSCDKLYNILSSSELLQIAMTYLQETNFTPADKIKWEQIMERYYKKISE